MATLLDHPDTRLVARVRSEWEFGNGGHSVGGAVVGTPGRAAVLDYFRLRCFWFSVDFADSVRDAQAFFEICCCIGRGTGIQQQYRNLTARLKHALRSGTNEQSVRARQ
jgi:hypothetical protein